MLAVRKYLMSGGTLEKLAAELFIHVKPHPRYPNLYLLKYDQIESPMANLVVQECRGIILDANDSWAPVAWPFSKFFNESEQLAATIDWSTARVLEKVDGSLIIQYYYDGRWNVATSGTPDASGDVNGLGMTFEKLFTSAARPLLGLELDPDITYMWELTSPFNRIVVQHAKPALTLIGMRNRITGQEYDVVHAPAGFPVVKHYPLTSMSEVMAAVADMEGLKQEGFVVVDDNFNRIKVKSLSYVAIHHMRGEGSLTPKRVLERVMAGEKSEILANFPEWAPMFEQVDSRLFLLVQELEAQYLNIKGQMSLDEVIVPANGAFSRKTFAGFALKTRCPAVMFNLLDAKAKTVREALAAMTLENLVAVLKLDEVDFQVKPVVGSQP